MNIFRRKHKHKFKYVKTVMAPSVLTGVPIQAGFIYKCSCGLQRNDISPAGYQQISWGVMEEDLFKINQ